VYKYNKNDLIQIKWRCYVARLRTVSWQAVREWRPLCQAGKFAVWLLLRVSGRLYRSLLRDANNRPVSAHHSANLPRTSIATAAHYLLQSPAQTRAYSGQTLDVSTLTEHIALNDRWNCFVECLLFAINDSYNAEWSSDITDVGDRKWAWWCYKDIVRIKCERTVTICGNLLRWKAGWKSVSIA